MLKIENISKLYKKGNKVNENINLEIKEGIFLIQNAFCYYVWKYEKTK